MLVLGTDLHVAMENHDAVNITFSSGQLALVQAVAQASPRPVVVVTLTAVPLDLTPLLQNPKIGAILHAGQPSIQTHGVADVLVGERSPAGRVVQTIYPESYQHQVRRGGRHSEPALTCLAAHDLSIHHPDTKRTTTVTTPPSPFLLHWFAQFV